MRRCEEVKIEDCGRGVLWEIWYLRCISEGGGAIRDWVVGYAVGLRATQGVRGGLRGVARVRGEAVGGRKLVEEICERSRAVCYVSCGREGAGFYWGGA